MKEIQLLKIDDMNQHKNNSNFYVNTIQNHLINNHQRIEKPHKHNFYAVFLFTKGSGTHEIDFTTYEVKPGAIFFLYPGQTHGWHLSDDIEGYLFFHTKEFYEMGYVNNTLYEYPFFKSNASNKCFYLDQIFTSKLMHDIENIYNEYLQNNWKKTQLILSYLTQIYILLNRQIESNSLIDHNSLRHYQNQFNTFEHLVDKYYKEIKSASEYAEKLNITQKHLNRIVKSITDKTTTNIIIERNILEAKRNLIYTNKTFNQIAQDLGYTDYSYFNKLFKKYTGETPTEFIKRYKK